MVDTMNTGTMPIEGNALMPESLRFESEPWTSFYMAGEIIRESRKASGKQRQYATGGNTARSDEVIDHCNHPRNVGSQPKDDSNGGTGLLCAPECGDVMKLQMKINSKPSFYRLSGPKTPSLAQRSGDGPPIRHFRKTS